MTKKRILAGCLLLCVLCMSFGQAFAREEMQMPTPEPPKPVVVALSTAPDGNLGTGLWSDNATDIDIRSLLHGYETVAMVQNLGIALNQNVLQSVREEEQMTGDDTMIFELKPGLTYNNGEAITARDYVFSALLLASPEVAELGGKPGSVDYLLGYDAYHKGETPMLSGVRLLSETSFSLTVRADQLPNFYGVGILDLRPYPISVIAPGCEVADDGAGAYLRAASNPGERLDERYAPGEFSKEMLSATLLDPVSGYEVNPLVTSGPYQLEGFDVASGTVRLRVNPNFAGNFEGKKPVVEQLEVRTMPSGNVIAALQNGEIDIATRVNDPQVVTQGRTLVQEVQGSGVRAIEYARTGLSMLAFACERGPLASENVRNAVALCLDKDRITREIGGEYAQRVYGYYGKDQWMPTYVVDLGASPEPIDPNIATEMDIARELELLNIPQDIAAAKALLETEGWTLNSEGGAYQENVDPMRYRNENGQLVPLRLWLAVPEGSQGVQRFRDLLTEALAPVGISVSSVQMSLADELKQYYCQDKRMFDMFFLSDGFSALFDPFDEVNVENANIGIANKTGINDIVLSQLAGDLRRTSPMDRDAYAMKWLDFQQRFMTALPILPLYSSTYFDFISDRVVAYPVDQYSGWALSMPYLEVR